MAADDEKGTGSSNRIVIISDGLETCDGDPVASAQGLLDQGIEVVVDVIGFDLAEADRASLEEVARVTGGTYTDARTGADLNAVLRQYIDQNRRINEAASCNWLAGGEVSRCNNGLGRDLFLYIQGELLPAVREAHGQDAFRFLQGWFIEAQIENEDAWRPRVEELRERSDEINVLYAEADARLEAFQEQTGIGSSQKPYVAFDCPYADTDHGQASDT